MENTKHDLAFQYARLDFEALLKTAAVAYRELHLHLTQELARYHDLSKPVIHPVYLDVIKRLANDFAIAGETYYTLLEASTRENIEILRNNE